MADSTDCDNDAATSHKEYSSKSCTSFSLKAIAISGFESTYSHLEESLVPRKGRGRHRAVPPVALTNRLLLQLRAIQHDHNMTRDDVGKWYEKLFPDSDYPCARVGALLGRAEKRVEALFDTGEHLTAYLDAPVDPDFVSPSLSERGVKIGHLMGKKTLESAVAPVTHEVVLDLEGYRKKEQLPRNFTCSWIKKLSGNTEDNCKLIRSIDKLMTCYNQVKVKAKQNPDLLSIFMATNFQSVTALKQAAPTRSEGMSEKEVFRRQEQTAKKVNKENATLKEKITSQEDQITILKETITELCQNKKELDICIKEKEKLQVEVVTLKEQIQLLKQKVNPRRIQQLIKSANKWKNTARSLNHSHAHLLEVKKELKRIKAKAMVAKCNLQRDIRRARNKVAALTEHNNALTKVIQDRELAAQAEAPQLQTREAANNRFTDNMRCTVLQLQGSANVPATQCTGVIKIVAQNLFGVDILQRDLPCTQTAVNMADEGHVLAQCQAVEKMLLANSVTLHSDGTTRGGKKIVGEQVTLDCGTTLTLGLTTVSCEDSTTLLELTVSLLEEICDTYATSQPNEDSSALLRQLLSKLSSTMTDRAPVMRCFSKKLQDFLSTQLGRDITVHFLNCNAHFLLGLSRSCETSMKQLQEELQRETGPLGRDGQPAFARFKSAESATSRLIRMASEITGPRGDDKNGCRGDWLAHCAELQVASRMTSYRSNRFNCFFLAAAAVIYHKDHLLTLFDGGRLGRTNTKINSVRADLEDNRLLCLVCSIALIYFNVTGPFWKLLESKTQYTQQYHHLQHLEQRVSHWRGDAADLMDPQYPGVFQDFSVASEMRQAVFEFAAANKIKVQTTLEFLMRDILVVIHTQLADFMPEGKFGREQPEEVQRVLQHCPLTNLLGESVFGQMDFSMGKARHASLHRHSTLLMLSGNKTGEWITTKDAAEKSRLMQMARSQRHQLRQKHRHQEQLVQLKLREKLLENERQQRLRQAKQAAKQAAIVRKVAEYGGPCRTSSDVRRLVSRLRTRKLPSGQIRAALLNEVRFQKQVLNIKGALRLSGSLEQLVRNLSAHLQQHPQQEPLNGEQEPQHEEQEPPQEEEEEQQMEEDADETTAADLPFTFQRQGQWVAVYYDEQFYIGQVLNVVSADAAEIQFLEKTSGRKDFFRWPRKEDVAEVKACFVFSWDFEVTPASEVGRFWKVPTIDRISASYDNIKSLN